MNTRSSLLVLPLLPLLPLFGFVTGCVIVEKQIGQLDAADDVDDLGDESSDGSDGTDSSDSGELVEDPNCTQAIDALEQLFPAQVGQACALVIRNAYTTGELLGWSLECDDDDTGYTLDDARNLSTWGGQDISQDERMYVLYAEPGDFGGLAVVGQFAGLLFDGDIVHDGVGGVNLPVDLEDPSSLGSGCIASQPAIAIDLSPYDVTNLEAPYTLPTIAELTIDALLDTAVFYVDWKEPTSVAIFVFPRSVGTFDPNTAEIVTVILPEAG